MSSPVVVPEEARDGGRPREWHRPLALGVFLLSAWVVGPVTLAAVPFLLMVVALPVRKRSALLVAVLVAFLLAGRTSDDGIHYLELGWALAAGGVFVGLTVLLPASRVTHRALGAVTGAGLLAAVGFALRPGSWSAVDWRVRDRLNEEVSQALALFRELQGGEPLPAALRESVYRSAEMQAELFPAVLALTTVAGLALAWWLYGRLALGELGALAPLREFRFADHLVWVVIAGLALLVLTDGSGWTRAGSNTLVFMGALYALRGAGVVLFLSGGPSLLGGLLVALGMLFMAPVLLTAAALIGLGDTWLDVRTRVRALLT
ncbi:MAG: DUF2232 domain-containing protein [Gemmatimonadales bacterium]|jgi:hypothetical protein|nr:MAG: DUF2232 domain-containing protein [Gemmatimonadales bacterium]